MVDSGITFNYAQLVADNEIIKMVRRTMMGIPISDEMLAIDVTKGAGIQGQFLSEEHTAKNFKMQLSSSSLICRESIDNWKMTGSKTMLERSREKAIDILENHKPTPLPESVATRISELIEEAEKELG